MINMMASNEIKKKGRLYPVVPLRGIVLFPKMILSFDVRRDRSIRALEQAMGADQVFFAVTQIDENCDDPQKKDLYPVGTLARVKQITRAAQDRVRIVVEGISRASLKVMQVGDEFSEANIVVHRIAKGLEDRADAKALMQGVMKTFEEYALYATGITPEVLVNISMIEDPSEMADTIAFNVLRRQKDKQEILSLLNPCTRLERLHVLILQDLEIAQIEQQVGRRVREQVEHNQREYFLQEQMRAIQSELGENDEDEMQELKAQILEAPMGEVVREKALKEYNRMRRTPSNSPDLTVIRNYLEWILDMPWGVESVDNLDISNAQRILDEDHYGLQDVKERILEYLSVKQLMNTLQGPILCFVGPPGVGKTSIAHSVAHAIGRKFVRMSLGGLRDEAEIMGHRRTYIGAIPGRIISNLKSAGTMNPVFLFDEIDKMNSDFRGDPASAMLEVLDSEQNHAFWDRYMEIPVDISHVMFLATANTVEGIPPALLDRMELIHISGYTDEEKLHIAQDYLLPRQRSEHGLQEDMLSISDAAMSRVIEGYTREAGVRALNRCIARICRRAARAVAQEHKQSVSVSVSNIEKVLGKARYMRDALGNENETGLVNALAWTSVGGEILKIEVSLMKGSGNLELTGQLGNVMKESAMAALGCIRTRTHQLGIEEDFYKNTDIHLHVPEGAIPKDGPSAGCAMAVAMVSALTGRKVLSYVAMTGEITLRGRILPIGGLKQKVLAAYREGVKRILIPKANLPDLEEIPQNVRRHLQLLPIETLDEALELALEIYNAD